MCGPPRRGEEPEHRVLTDKFKAVNKHASVVYKPHIEELHKNDHTNTANDNIVLLLSTGMLGVLYTFMLELCC